MNSKRFYLASSLALCCLPLAAQLTQVWAQPYNGDASSTDSAYAIAVDKYGNTFTTGTATQTTGGLNAVTVKYDALGTKLWEGKYDGATHGTDESRTIAVDNEGNSYVGGYADAGTTNHKDMLIVKYAADGTQAWAQTYDNSHQNDEVNDICVDSQGNVYVTGKSAYIGVFGAEYLTIKYDSSGNIVSGWPKTYTESHGVDYGVAIGVDGSGCVYVTGRVVHTVGGGVLGVYGTIKYEGNGTQDWVHHYWGSTGKDSEPRDLAVDNSGDCFVTGQIAEGTGGSVNDDYGTVCYDDDSNGTELWTMSYSGTSSGSDDLASALALNFNVGGEAVYVYVTGASGGGTSHDFATLKYDAATGSSIWTSPDAKRYDRASSDDSARAIAVNGNGVAYVTGEAKSSLGVFGFATIAYDKDGAVQASAVIFSSGSGDDFAKSISVSSAGVAHVAGIAATNASDYESIKYEQGITEVDPGAYTINFGSLSSGNLSSLTASDNSRMEINSSVPVALSDPPIRIEVTGTSPTLTPKELCLRIEGQTNVSPVRQTVEFYDYTSALWRTMDVRQTTNGSDSVVHVNVGYDPARFVSSGYVLKARMNYENTGPIFTNPWKVKLDEVTWEVVQ